MNSLSFTEEVTFTISHARDIGAKVATDLKRLQRFYDCPSDSDIIDYESELIELLRGGYVDKVFYGFRRAGLWIEPTLIYTARDLAGRTAANDDPGKIRPGCNVSGSAFYSYLIYSSAWSALTAAQRAAVQRNLPFERPGASQPGINGYTLSDRTYSAGGRALERASVRGF